MANYPLSNMVTSKASIFLQLGKATFNTTTKKEVNFTQ